MAGADPVNLDDEITEALREGRARGMKSGQFWRGHRATDLSMGVAVPADVAKGMKRDASREQARRERWEAMAQRLRARYRRDQ